MSLAKVVLQKLLLLLPPTPPQLIMNEPMACSRRAKPRGKASAAAAGQLKSSDRAREQKERARVEGEAASRVVVWDKQL